MRTFLPIAIVCAAGACSSSDDLNAFRTNVGKSACNQTNGVYVGRIVDVTTYTTASQTPAVVYVVERKGNRTNVLVTNTTVAERCPDGQPTLQSLPPAEQPGPPPDVDRSLRPVADEFGRRLGASQGILKYMKVQSDTLNVKWTSQRCDLAAGEVIDLLLSINRGHPGPFTPGIKGELTCSGKTRVFLAPSGRFQEYRTGQINDPDILRGLK